MNKLSCIVCFTILSFCVLDNCQANETSIIQQQMSDTLKEMDRVRFQFFQKSNSFCESIAYKYTNNYYTLVNYIPRFLEKVYTINTDNNKQINSIDELFNLNKSYNNNCLDLNKLPDDNKNNELLYNILVASNQNHVIQDINEIFKTRKQIDNLKKIFENLETRKIQIISQRHHKKNKIIKDKN